MTISGYIYAAVWFVLAAYLIYLGVKGSRILLIPGCFFIFLGAWALIDELSEIDLMGGPWGWIYRAAALAALIPCAIWYFRAKNDR